MGGVEGAQSGHGQQRPSPRSVRGRSPHRLEEQQQRAQDEANEALRVSEMHPMAR